MTEEEADELEGWWRVKRGPSPRQDMTNRLERAMHDTLRKLGLRATVMYDSHNDGFYFDCGLAATPRAGCLIDSEMIYATQRTHFVDLLTRELMMTRDRVFDAARRHMGDLDGRIAYLTLAEKSMLHELLMDLENFVLDGGQFREESRRARCAKYRELLLRLFK